MVEKHSKRRPRLLLGLGALTGLTFAIAGALSAPDNAPALSVNEVVALVNGVQIRGQHYERALLTSTNG